MEAKAWLLEMKSTALHEIEVAAQQGSSDDVISITKRLERIEKLLSRYEQLLREVKALAHDSTDDTMPDLLPGMARSMLDEMGKAIRKASPREQGKLRKAEFLEKLSNSGVRLHQIKGSLFKNPLGIIVGIAYASERQDNAWFLGLPANKFDHAILLCEAQHGEVFAISLPGSFFDKHGSALSQSKGQVKFNIAKRRDRYYLSVPRVGSVDVEEYRDNFDELL